MTRSQAAEQTASAEAGLVLLGLAGRGSAALAAALASDPARPPLWLDPVPGQPPPPWIVHLAPGTRMIALLGNPVRRLVAEQERLAASGRFPQLVRLGPEEMILRNWPAGSDVARLEALRQRLITAAGLGLRLARGASHLGPENVLALHEDDLCAHWPEVMAQVFRFLGRDMPKAALVPPDLPQDAPQGLPSAAAQLQLLGELGADYLQACQGLAVCRPQAPAGLPAFSQPVGALVGDVGIGADGWLFLAGGSNHVLEMYLEPEDRHLAVCRQWHGIIARRIREMAGLGARYLHVMVPEKLTILGDRLGWPIDHRRSRGASLNTTAPAGLRPHLVDLVSAFRTSGDPERLYLKTDSHWSRHGAFAAYEAICARLGAVARPELKDRPSDCGTLVLDLGGKLPQPPAETVAFARFRQEAQLVSDAGLVRYKRAHGLENEGALHVGSHVEFRNDRAPNSQRILIFGDSFCEYRDHLLTALLAETFRHTTFVWSTSLDPGLCARQRPDLVLGVMTERFMARRPDDRFDLEAHTRAVLEGRPG